MGKTDRNVLVNNNQEPGMVADPNKLEESITHAMDIIDSNDNEFTTHKGKVVDVTSADTVKDKHVSNNDLKKLQDQITSNTNNLNSHKTATTLDHPDKSVTEAKIGDKAVSRRTIATGAVGKNELDITLWEQTANQAKFIEIDDKIGVSLDKSNFIGVKEYKNLKVAIASGYDWQPAIQKAINDASVSGKKVVLHADEDMYLTSPIVPTTRTKIAGFGKYNSTLKPIGAIKAIDLSSADAKTGVEISSISIVGDSTVGQIGIDAYYLVNGSTIKDIRISNVDTGIKVTKCWYGAFSEIFIHGCVGYGLHVISASSTDQVNAISFKSVFINGCNINVFLDGINVAAAVQFDSCTFEKSKKTSVISNGFSPLKFVNCYFESNYMDGVAESLTWSNPIDVKITGTTVRNVVVFDSCYFARRNDFATSTQKTSIYLGENIKAVFITPQFQCNTGGHIDSNIYSISNQIPYVFHASEDGFAKQMYTGVVREKIHAIDPSVNLRYTSTTDTLKAKHDGNKIFLKFVPHATGTVAEVATFRLYNLATGTQIGTTVSMPTSFTQDVPVELDFGPHTPCNVVEVRQITATTTDLNGSLYLFGKVLD